MYPNYPQNQPPYPGQMPPMPEQNSYPPNMGYPPQQPAYQAYPGMPGAPMPYGNNTAMPQNQSMPYGNMPQNQYGAFPAPQNPTQFGGYSGMPQQFGGPPQMQYGNPSIPPVNEFQQQQHVYNQQQQTPQVSHQMAPPQARPTLVRNPNFDAGNDAAVLRKAMKGFGTDEDALVNVLCRRTCDQRMEIARAFKTAYGKDLIDNIRKETSKNFQKLLVALLTPRIIYYCEEIQAAMEGTGTDEEALIEILCGGLPNREVQAITFEFQRLYGQNLEDAIKGETSHSFKRLLVSLSTGGRDESMVTNLDSARRDAQSLIDAGVKQFGTDESEFNRILCLRNYEQIRLIANEYEKMTGNSLEKDIKREFSGDVEKGMVSVLRCAINRPLFFAKCMHNAVAGFGTDDRSLIRLCVTRSEIDMMDIKEEYQRKYNESLRDAIKGDTSGHYKHALYVLIGENRT